MTLLCELPDLFLLGVLDIPLILSDALQRALLGSRLTCEPLLSLVLFFVLLGDLDHECHIFGLTASSLEVTLELLLLADEGLDVLFVDQDLL